MFAKTARFAAMSLLAAVQLVACGGGSAPPHTKFVDITLPPGSTHSKYVGRGHRPDNEEDWDVPESYSDLLAAMRRQLPLHHDLDGVPWCDEDNDDPNNTSWIWQKAGDKIEVGVGGDAKTSGLSVIRTRGSESTCEPRPRPGPPQVSTSGAATVIGLWFQPADLVFSSGSDKLYMADISGKPKTFTLSLSAPTRVPPQLDTKITDGVNHIVVNNKLKLGYALASTGQLRVFNTDTDTLVSTTDHRTCEPQVVAVDESSGMVYGGGQSNTGECLVSFDSAGHLLAEKDVTPKDSGQNRMIQRIAADPASGDVIYLDPSGVGRADRMLTEKWRTPAAGVSTSGDVSSGLHASNMAYEPSSATVYVCINPMSLAAPATVAVYDARSGQQTGTFGVPSSVIEFVADQQGRVFVGLNNSGDVSVLDHGAKALSTFQTFPDKPVRSTVLAADPGGHRLFAVPGSGTNVYQYPY